MDDALREALSGSLSEANDQEIVDVLATAAVPRTDAAAVDTYATVAGRFGYSQIDGRHAVQESDIRLLVGTATLTDWGALVSDGLTAVEHLRNIVGGLRVSPLIAAAAGNKQDVMVRKGAARDMVAPIWEGVEIITDNVTKAKTGEIVVTARIMSDRAVTRAGGFGRVQAQHV